MSYSYIENELERITGLKVEFIKPESSFDCRLNLNTKAKKINLYNKDKSLMYITMANPEISIRPFSIIFKRLCIKNIKADYIEIYAKRNKFGEIDLIKSIDKNFYVVAKKILKFKLTKLNMDIDKITLYLNDKYLINKTHIVNLYNTDVKIQNRKKNLSIKQTGNIITKYGSIEQISKLKVDIFSMYPMKNFNSDKLFLDIKIDNFNHLILNDLFRKYISKDIFMFFGNSNLEIKSKDDKKNVLNLKINNPTLKLKNGKTISPYKNGIDINILFKPFKDKITFDSFSIKSNKLNVNVNGEILDYLTKKSKYDLKLDVKNTELNNFIYFLPDNLISYQKDGIKVLKKSNFFGNINGKINFKYSPLDITGNLKINNIYIPNYPKSYKTNDVNLIFMKDKLRVYTRVYTPKNEYIMIDGVSNLDNSLYGKYSVKSTSNIDLAFAQLYLIPIQKIIGFDIGPLPIMKVSGLGEININTQGTLYDAQIFGYFKAKNATAQIMGLDAKLKNGICELIFDDRNLIFKIIKGKLDNADFILTGNGNTKGEVNLNTKIINAKTDRIFKIFKNSVISKPYKKQIAMVEKANGNLEADINLVGLIDDYESINMLEKLKLSGVIKFIDTNVELNNGLFLEKLHGAFSFGREQLLNIKYNIGASIYNLKLISKDNLDKISKGQKFLVNILLTSDSIYYSDVIQTVEKLKNVDNSFKEFIKTTKGIDFVTKLFLKSSGEMSLNDINLKNFKNNGHIIGLNDEKNKNIKFNSGMLKIENSNLYFNNFGFNFKDGKITLNGSINDFLTKRPSGNLNVFLDKILIENVEKIFPNIKVDKAYIKNGHILFKNNNLKFNALSMDLDSMPIFTNAQIKDIYNSKILEAHFSTILNENTSDNIINPYLIYPVKITGEVPIKGDFLGNINNYSINFSTIIPKKSDISFSGANLGDINYKRELQGKINVKDKIATLNDLKLIKFIANQNNKVNPIVTLKANGNIIQKNNKLVFNNLRVMTNTPINVRVLNLIFKKSLLKKGNFEADIVLNGDINLPKLMGRVNLYDLDIPMYDTEINSINAIISDKYADGEILAKNKNSDVKIKIHALNKTTTPYIVKDVIVSSDELYVNDILDSIVENSIKTDIVPKNSFILKNDDVIVEKGNFEFKSVQYEGIKANNLKGNLNYKNGIFNLYDVLLNIADGVVIANGKYDLNTTNVDINANMENCDSNLLAKEFLNLPNQIFGKMNGFIEFSGKNLTSIQSIRNIKSNVDFSINNGKMPKLGSMEYLLRTGNLVKNGLLGLSLNNIIEVLTPYKTGEFENIVGKINIANGEIEKLNILTKGKNLSLYLDGNYSILENFADIKIYGKLSQKISNALGVLGNASISQFIDTITQNRKSKNQKDEELNNILNKIPVIEVETPSPRYFKVKVLGDINKDSYIKSFDWI